MSPSLSRLSLDLTEHDEEVVVKVVGQDRVHKYASTLADRDSPLLAEVLGYDPRDTDPLTVTEGPTWRAQPEPVHHPHELVVMAWGLVLVALIALAMRAGGYSPW